MYYYDPTFILVIIALIFALVAQSKVKGNYKKYSKIPNSVQVSGAETARSILDSYGLEEVTVQPVEGMLSDHYDPIKKCVSLSKDVYYGKSISAVSIAAHEVGHALQHAQSYAFLNFRFNLLPIANFGSYAAFPLFFIGFLFGFPTIMDIGIWVFSAVLLFHLVTLPVEFNASRRAFSLLRNGYILDEKEMKGVKAVLNAAALTYVASTLMVLIHLVRMIVLRGSRS